MLDNKSGARDDMAARYIQSDIANVAHNRGAEKRGLASQCFISAVQAACQASDVRLRRFGRSACTQGDQHLSDLFKNRGRHAKRQRCGADLQHQKGLLVIVLTDIDGAERQRTGSVWRRIGFRRGLQPLRLATQHQHDADKMLDVLDAQAEIYGPLLAPLYTQSDRLAVWRNLSTYLSTKGG